MKRLNCFVFLLISYITVHSTPLMAQTSTPAYPNILEAWDSSFGKIYWVGQNYGDSSKIITGKIELDSSSNKWVYKGRWGRVENNVVSYKGNVRFIFTDYQETKIYSETAIGMADMSSFTGYYDYFSNPGQSKPWTGKISERSTPPNFSFKGRHPSQEGVLNIGLIDQIKSFDSYTRWHWTAKEAFLDQLKPVKGAQKSTSKYQSAPANTSKYQSVPASTSKYSRAGSRSAQAAPKHPAAIGNDQEKAEPKKAGGIFSGMRDAFRSRVAELEAEKNSAEEKFIDDESQMGATSAQSSKQIYSLTLSNLRCLDPGDDRDNVQMHGSINVSYEAEYPSAQTEQSVHEFDGTDFACDGSNLSKTTTLMFKMDPQLVEIDGVNYGETVKPATLVVKVYEHDKRLMDEDDHIDLSWAFPEIPNSVLATGDSLPIKDGGYAFGDGRSPRFAIDYEWRRLPDQ